MVKEEDMEAVRPDILPRNINVDSFSETESYELLGFRKIHLIRMMFAFGWPDIILHCAYHGLPVPTPLQLLKKHTYNGLRTVGSEHWFEKWKGTSNLISSGKTMQ